MMLGEFDFCNVVAWWYADVWLIRTNETRPSGEVANELADGVARWPSSGLAALETRVAKLVHLGSRGNRVLRAAQANIANERNWYCRTVHRPTAYKHKVPGASGSDTIESADRWRGKYHTGETWTNQCWR